MSSESPPPFKGPIDAFVRHMSHEELAAQHERQSENRDVFMKTVIRPYKEVVARRNRKVNAERQQRHRDKKKSLEIALGIRNKDGKLVNRLNAISTKARHVHFCNEYSA